MSREKTNKIILLLGLSRLLNPLHPDSDQHQISLCLYQRVLSHRGHENKGYDHSTRIPLAE